MAIAVAKQWFEFSQMDDGITRIREPYVDVLIRSINNDYLFSDWVCACF